MQLCMRAVKTNICTITCVYIYIYVCIYNIFIHAYVKIVSLSLSPSPAPSASLLASELNVAYSCVYVHACMQT